MGVATIANWNTLFVKLIVGMSESQKIVYKKPAHI